MIGERSNVGSAKLPYSEDTHAAARVASRRPWSAPDDEPLSLRTFESFLVTELFAVFQIGGHVLEVAVESTAS